MSTPDPGIPPTPPESETPSPRVKPASEDPGIDVSDMHNIHELHAPIIREQREPRDGMEPIPPWLAVVFGALIFWGGYYMARYSAGFQADIYDENAVHYGRITTGDAQQEDPLAKGKKLYTIHCGGCHQQSGKGEAGKFPPLADSSWVTGPVPILVRIPLHGLQGPITVEGTQFNGNMPAFGPRLKDDELASILTYIRQAWGNSADAVSPELVAAIREEAGSRVTPWTESELKSIPAKLPQLPEKKSDPASKDDVGERDDEGKEESAASSNKPEGDRAGG